MNNKATVYMVLAVALGYLLIAAVPGQVAMYTQPSLMRAGEDSMIFEAPESGENTTITLGVEPDSEEIQSDEAHAEAASASTFDAAQDAAEAAETRNALSGGLVSLFGWWAIDLVIALSVYYVARRLFT
ncbi:MAG: hypothetical protein NWE89_11700 [Candidatus Bathyarchaeota archaeon]|nr:hypothetical protein [Candidatus Bathyarchaeota archaeon]